jgi:hypothetical protein
MTHTEWLDLMQFPPEWAAWQLIPSELAAAQLAGFEPGHEEASEHDRHGAFQWWLKRQPRPEVLVQLAQLSWLDPDPLMAKYVRECISQQPGCNAAVAHALGVPYQRA